MTGKPNGRLWHPLWTKTDIATAARMWRELVTRRQARGETVRERDACAAIGREIGRTAGAVHARRHDYGDGFDPLDGYTPRADYGGSRQLTSHVEVTREALAQARHRQSLTGAVFGDPPPGFSALDQKRAQVAS